MAGITGAVLLLLASVLAAGAVVKKEREKLWNLCEMERALFLLQNEISFSEREIREACEGLAYAVEGGVSRLFFEISDAMKADETLSFAACWNQVAQDMFSPEAKAVLKSFAATFGTLSKAMEEQAVSCAGQRLKTLIPVEKERFAQNRKLAYALCLGAGLATVILLI